MEFAYGFNGAAGYLYESAKDRLRWSGISVKRWVHLVMRVGSAMAMPEDKYNQERAKHVTMSDDSIASALIAAFGSGKKAE